MSTDYLKIKQSYSDQLYHYGVKGQRWGIRRYQNENGSLTAEGKQKYGTIENFNKHLQDKKAIKKSAFAGAGKGAAAVAIGATLVAAAIGAIGITKLHSLDKNPKASMNDVLKTSAKTLKALNLAKAAYFPAIGVGAATGATIGAISAKKKKNDINHSGIKGMKWGIRRYQNEDGSLTDAGKVRYNADLSKKKVEKMSNDELNKANQRLSAERTYNMLTGKNYKNRPANVDIALRAGASAIGSAILSSGAYLIREKAKHPEIGIGKSALKTAGLLGILGATVGSVSSVATSLGGQTSIQNIGDQAKKKK